MRRWLVRVERERWMRRLEPMAICTRNVEAGLWSALFLEQKPTSCIDTTILTMTLCSTTMKITVLFMQHLHETLP